MPPVEALQLLRAERLKLKSDREEPPFMVAYSNRSRTSSSEGSAMEKICFARLSACFSA
jgi:hypothetical protein